MVTVTFDEAMERLFTFSRDVQAEDFQAIFGPGVGAHLFEKFAGQYAFDILALWGTLSSENKALLAGYLTIQEATS